MPVGGDAVLECRIRHGGDSILVWKNGTRVISVGDLQVGAVALMQQSAGATYYSWRNFFLESERKLKSPLMHEF